MEQASKQATPLAAVPVPKKKMTSPWKPASILHVDQKGLDQNKGRRWLRVDNLDKAMAEGWTPVPGKHADKTPTLTLTDGTQLGNLIRKRGLVLCEMDKEIIEARNQFYREMAEGALNQSVKKLEEDMKDEKHEGVGAYGNIKIERT